MAPPTLVSMAQRNLIRNLSNLQDVGDAPYAVVKPALRKIADPEQLHNIEIASPHIADADGELWQAFIKRDIMNWKDKMVTPRNPRSWWKVYRKLYREEKAAQEEQARQLKEAFQRDQKDKEENQTNFLSATVKRRERQATFLDGHINPKAGSYGFERVGTVSNAKKSGKNIISAIRKAATKPAHLRPHTSTRAEGTVEPKMWQTESAKRSEPSKMQWRGPAPTVQRLTHAALSQAIKEDERIKKEKAERKLSTSPPPWATEQAHSPPKPQPAQPAAVMKAAAATSPPRTASPAVANSGMAALGPGAGTKRTMSPANASPAPPQKRQRPPTSIFMPKRVKR